MFKKTILHQTAFRFRRFSRAGYAAFRSMHRVVNIGRLASYIADHQLRKSAAVVALLLPVLGNTALAQSYDSLDEHLLPALDIIAVADSLSGSPDAVAVITHSQLQGLAVSSVGELLEQLSGIDLRTRGGNDVQSDLTMRGGTFDQMIVLLNGINLNDAQTGHHNLDIPLDLTLVDRVEIIPSSALIHYGVTSLCGAVNIVTVGRPSNQARLSLSAGSFGQAHLIGSANRVVGAWRLMAAASYHRSNGYQPNTDYSFGNLWLQAHRHSNQGDWLVQLGAQSKDFGSQAFYSTKYPFQFEATRTLLSSISYQRKISGWDLEASLYGRLHKDRFELFRSGYAEAPAWYGGHNYHLSANLGLRLRTSRLWSLGRTTFGTELRDESILSNVLGDSLAAPVPVFFEPAGHYYTLAMSRLTTNLFAEHSVYLNNIRITASLLGLHNTRMGFNHGYALSAKWPVTDAMRLSGSVGRSLRLPTYTDLYYHSATQVSNPALKPEAGYNAELSLSYRRSHFFSQATLYARRGTDIIDWIRMPDEDVWHSTNHAQIDALGCDLQAAYHGGGFLRRLGLAYSYCCQSQQPDGFISAYVLDYLRQKVSLDAMVSPVRNLRIKLLATHFLRQGSYTDSQGLVCSYAPVLLVNAGAEYDLRGLTLFAEGYNLLNRQYADYGGIPQPGISFLAGLRLRL